MPYYKSSQEWLEQSVLLLEARPETTRITTKYSISSPSSRKSKPTGDDIDATSTDASSAPQAPRASLVLKTYDPVGGVTLKYRTTKAAEVSRLIYASLGRLGRKQAAAPDLPELSEEPMPDAPPVAEAAAAAAGASAQQGAVGKKKKKGKK
jgi:hypothetical protein